MTCTDGPFRSVFEDVYDVVIFGGGYAGFAAAKRLQAQAKRVLLVERRAALLWESGWAFATQTGESKDPLWGEWMRELASRHGSGRGVIDGAIAEVLASEFVRTRPLPVLYYVTPMAVERESGLLEAVIVGTKSGPSRLMARQWIDATETGELLCLVQQNTPLPAARARRLSLFFRNVQWPAMTDRELQCPELSGARLTWRASLWDNERTLGIELPGTFARPVAAWLPALRALRAAQPEAMDEAVLTHGSVVPLDVYEGRGQITPAADLPANVSMAIPALAGVRVETLAQRFDLGLAAATQLETRSAASVKPKAFASPIDWSSWPVRSERAQVAVAGVGTGGALATIAAARQGADVLGFDPLPFAGGIGAGGGIHWYYYGVKGGLQEELDERIRQITPLFGKTPQTRGFHPDAKKVVLDEMLHESGARLLTGATLVDVVLGGSANTQRVEHALIATPSGPMRLNAEAWIDSTGDGDLACASRHFVMGRPADGLPHAYSQSSGRANVQDNQARMVIMNYDAGWVDPADAQDLTRARLVGISHYLQRDYSAIERPTYIAPAIGLRQARQIETDYMLTLADLIERRTFPDSVGLTGSHYDNHAVDYEFESDEALFWVWVCRQWGGRTACEIPYRMVLPRGLENVWIACRAAGVSAEAHHSFRMQRDVQRLGEVAGLAAALAIKNRCSNRQVPMPALREQLARTGAIQLPPADGEDHFGPEIRAGAFQQENAEPTAEQLQAWVRDLREAPPGFALWHLYRSPRAARPLVAPLATSDDPATSWRAAAILAMWSDPQAEPRLCQAIRQRESGFESSPAKDRPDSNHRVAPHWLIAISLLRRCGTAACLRDLWDLACQPDLLLNARTAIALTCESLMSRIKLNETDRNLVIQTLQKLLATTPPTTSAHPQRNVSTSSAAKPPSADPTARPPVIEDFTWQLHLAVAKAEQAAGLKVHPQAQVYQVDPRALVRRAFAAVSQRY